MIKKVAATAVLFVLVAAGIWAVSRNEKPAENPARLQVSASYYPLYEFARHVGGDRVQVTNMTPAGAEPHDFEPAARDLADAGRSKVFVYNGGSFEPWAAKFAQSYAGIPVRASAYISLKQGGHEDHAGEHAQESGAHQEDEHDRAATDPHFWLDPVLARQIINNIRDGLTKADPEHAGEYARNASAYNKQLIQLDQEFRDGLKQCQQRTVVVSHQSMSYLAARYNLTVEAVAGLSPESEPSAARVAELAQLVKTQNIKYILFESLVSPRLADTIAKETGAATLALDPIEGLTDEEANAGKNYLSIQRENLGNLRRALSCQ